MQGYRDLDPDGAQWLIQAIVDRATKDYLYAPEASDVYWDAVRFFLSDWFECLTGLDGRATLKNLKTERAKKHRRKRGILR